MKYRFPSFIIAILFLCSHIRAQSNQPALQITHLTGDLYVYITYNNYKGTLYPSNSMYLITTAGAILFDTPWDTTQFQPLLDSIKARHNKDAIFCISTHFHEDRTGGLEYYASKGISTWSSKQTYDLCASRNFKQAKNYFLQDTVFRYGEYSFTAAYAGAGHTPDNIVVWLGKDKVLYGGCLVKSTDNTDLGNIADAKLDEWDDTLRLLLKKFRKRAYVIPGHLSWANNKSIEHTLKLLKEHAAKTSK